MPIAGQGGPSPGAGLLIVEDPVLADLDEALGARRAGVEGHDPDAVALREVVREEPVLGVAEEEPEQVPLGDVVRHDRFGVGRVADVEPGLLAPRRHVVRVRDVVIDERGDPVVRVPDRAVPGDDGMGVVEEDDPRAREAHDPEPVDGRPVDRRARIAGRRVELPDRADAVHELGGAVRVRARAGQRVLARLQDGPDAARCRRPTA